MVENLRFVIVLALVGGFSSPSVSAADTSAETLLHEVSSFYTTLNRFRLEAAETTITQSGDLEKRTESRLATAVDDSGRFRVASDHPTDGGIVAFDGEATSIYLARRNQYQKINGAMLEGANGPALIRLKNRFTSRYGDITTRLRSATFVSSESLQVNGRQQECRVVEAAYDAPRGLAAEQIVRKYWIGVDRPLVYQESSEFQATNRAAGRATTVSQRIRFHLVEVGAVVTDDAFAPALPEEAQLVTAFDDADTTPVGRPAAVFELEDLGRVARSSSDLTGKVALLDFWASWCVPCRVDLPRVEALHRELSEKGLVVLGVNDESPEKARAFVSAHDLTFPTLSDTGSELFRAYEVRTIPTAVVIDRQGKVSSYLVGSHSAEELRQALRKAGLE